MDHHTDRMTGSVSGRDSFVKTADCVYHYASPLGGITMAGNGDALTGLWFDGQKHFAAGLSPDCRVIRLPVFDETIRWLDIYFSGRAPDFTPALRPDGTAFRLSVWEILLKIPFGRTVSYGQIAEKLSARAGGCRVSARAVGGAVSRNPVSLIIPCHRVIGADGRLTGYAGGTDKKEKLLRLEGAVPESHTPFFL